MENATPRAIVEAYGFDLSPIAARHAEFVQLAAEARAEREALRRLRRRTTIARKGIVQILETARDYAFEGEEWPTLERDARAIAQALARGPAGRDGSGGPQPGTAAAQGSEHLEMLLKKVKKNPLGGEMGPTNIPTNQTPILKRIR